jgi:DNA topoisomerase IA
VWGKARDEGTGETYSDRARCAREPERRLLSADFAALVERKTSGQPGTVTKASRDRKAETAPLPYSLADLQVDAGRRLGLGPKVILEVCQALYETHRLTTYPRSDCSYLPEGHHAQAGELARPIASIEPKLANVVGAADLSLRPRAFNDAKVTAHHALIPTPRSSTGQPLSKMERDVYNLIARRHLAQFFPPFECFQLDAEITVAGQRFTAKGRQPIAVGWKRLFDTSAERADQDGADGGPTGEEDLDPESPLPALQAGQAISIAKTRTVEKKTKPPRRFTAAGLVQAMTGIAKYVSNPQIKALLRETDGTPGLWASTVPRCCSTRWRTIARPRPRPPCTRVLEVSSCVNRLKTCGRNAGSIPAPVSLTWTRACPFVASNVTATRLPSRENLIALVSRLETTCCRRTGSPATAPRVSSRMTSSAIDFA